MDTTQEKETGASEIEKKLGQIYNYTDQELIRQLVKSRMAQGKELEYEDLSGYELPPRTQFSMLCKPALSLKYGKMTFNMASIRLFDEALYILTPVNPQKKRLMVVPCKEEESASLQWARIRESDDLKVNKTISSEEFVLKLYKLMGWKLGCRYKVLGRVALAKPGPMPVLIFDLSEAIMFDSKPLEFVDEETGEIKKKQVKYYPEEYKDRIGKSYNDYVEGKQLNLFEFLEEYTGQSYSDLPAGTDASDVAGIQTYSALQSENDTSEAEVTDTASIQQA